MHEGRSAKLLQMCGMDASLMHRY